MALVSSMVLVLLDVKLQDSMTCSHWLGVWATQYDSALPALMALCFQAVTISDIVIHVFFTQSVPGSAGVLHDRLLLLEAVTLAANTLHLSWKHCPVQPLVHTRWISQCFPPSSSGRQSATCTTPGCAACVPPRKAVSSSLY